MYLKVCVKENMWTEQIIDSIKWKNQNAYICLSCKARIKIDYSLRIHIKFRNLTLVSSSLPIGVNTTVPPAVNCWTSVLYVNSFSKNGAVFLITEMDTSWGLLACRGTLPLSSALTWNWVVKKKIHSFSCLHVYKFEFSCLYNVH